MKTTQAKYLTILKTLYDPQVGEEELQAVGKAVRELTETEQVDFANFQHYVGEIFLKLMEELDQGLEDLASDCPDEPDPRKWEPADWLTFRFAVFGHPFEEFYTTYAKQEPNLHLMWKEIEKRI